LEKPEAVAVSRYLLFIHCNPENAASGAYVQFSRKRNGNDPIKKLQPAGVADGRTTYLYNFRFGFGAKP
jgi:hypothetical protein